MFCKKYEFVCIDGKFLSDLIGEYWSTFHYISGKTLKMIKEVLYLMQKDASLELKKPHLYGSIILYMFAVLYIVNFLFQDISMQAWNVLFWIIILFSSIQVCVKGFQLEEGEGRIFFYQLASAESYFLSKLIYNTILIFLIELICLIGFHFISEIRLIDYGGFIVLLFMVSLGLSAIMSFTSILATQSRNQGTLISILSFPLVIPIILEAVKLTSSFLGFISDTSITEDFTLLLGIDILIIAVGLLLFPYLWRE